MLWFPVREPAAEGAAVAMPEEDWEAREGVGLRGETVICCNWDTVAAWLPPNGLNSGTLRCCRKSLRVSWSESGVSFLETGAQAREREKERVRWLTSNRGFQRNEPRRLATEGDEI